jgi:MFS family permease
MSAGVLDRLLRTPREIAEDCRTARGAIDVARAALVAIVVGAALFGGVVGSWRGGWQVAFAALKLPLVSIATLAIAAPAFFVITHVFGRPWPVRAVVSLMLAAGARLSLVLLASTPVLWLLVNLGASYPLVKLLAALFYGLAGIAALALLVQGVGRERGRAAIVSTFVCVFLLVGGQVAWVLRPYIGMPDRTAEVAFFTREREGGLVYQLFVSAGQVLDPRSARGER